MKFIPILFSGPMVRANLEGTKTQTRRIVSLQPPKDYLPKIIVDHFKKWWLEFRKSEVLVQEKLLKFKYGQPGDVLWVRESFNVEQCPLPPEGDIDGTFYFYKSTEKEYTDMKWKSSIHMPKEACRLFLNIKSIRIEKLQDISETDAITEGVLKDVALPIKDFKTKILYRDYTKKTAGCEDARSSYMTLWISLHGEDSWKENPWVWVIEYSKIDKPENFITSK